MISRLLKFLNPFRLLNSVPLGITFMVLTALYIAVGSGRPWLRLYGIGDWPGLRYWFDLTDLQFFDAWPLKVLMGLLIANLVVVTWRRIPLTPPRYGVWCVHSGIITLILSTSFYYHNKLEGRVRLYVNPTTGLNTADHYYDKDQRALYLKVGRQLLNGYPLPELPKFKDYDASLGNTDALVSRGLFNLDAYLDVPDEATGKVVRKNISDFMGWKAPLKLSVIGYYPYARVTTDFVEDPASDTTGVQLSMPDLQQHMGQTLGPWWLISTDSRFSQFPLADDLGIDLEQISGDAKLVAAATEAAGKIFKLEVKLTGIPGGDHAETLYVQAGKSYPIGKTGYTLSIENYNPAWPMFGTHEMVRAMTLKITSPTQTYRRMVLDGTPLQTDFKLGVAGAPPIGKRQKQPLDKNLTINFTVNDPDQLLPREGTVKHTLITLTDAPGVVDVVAGFSTVGSVTRYDSGSGDLEIAPPSQEASAPFAPQPPAGDDSSNEPSHPPIKLHFQRMDHLRGVDSIRPVPAARRERNAEDEGIYQVAKVKVAMGDWSTVVIVPFADQVVEAAQNNGIMQPWSGGMVRVPGVKLPLQLQLGQTRRPLPARLTIDKFDLIPYAGGRVDQNSLMRDFRSTVTINDSQTGEQITDVAHMNHPIYFRNGQWLFFQAAYDGQSRAWTELGVGNRPGVTVMILGCVMIFAGLLYAFYAKPLIIRRMKKKAIARALAAGKKIPQPAEVS